MPWTLLVTHADWDNYKDESARKLGIAADVIDWGRGPQDFPCLVSSFAPDRARVLSCYAYKADALKLLNAAGADALKAVALPVQPPAELPAQLPQGPYREQDAFNRDVAAQLLTLAYFVVESGLARHDVYEAKLGEMRDNVAAWTQERLVAALRPGG